MFCIEDRLGLGCGCPRTASGSSSLVDTCVVSPVPALAWNGIRVQQDDEYLDEEQQGPEQPPGGLLDGIMWMAVPKKRRSIEINRTRRRAVEKLIKVKVWLKCIHVDMGH